MCPYNLLFDCSYYYLPNQVISSCWASMSGWSIEGMARKKDTNLY